MKKTMDEIKEMPIWILWKKRPRGTQMSMIPIASSGELCGTSENYADHWVTFDEAQQSVAKRKADGIGFRIPKGIFFLDIDLVRDSATQGILKYVYKDGVYTLYDQNMLYGAIKQFTADYNESLVKMSVVKEVAQLILSDLDYLSQDNLNVNEDLINFQNGLLRVSGDTVKLLPHSPKVLSTIQIPCKWSDQEVSTPVFDQFLDTLTDGDPEVKQLLLEVMGVAISNVKGWRTKKALFLVGDGNTGKSQLKSLTARLLGKNNYIGMDLSEIEARFRTGSLYGKRLAGSSDMSFLSVDELKVFKKLTGGDDVHMEFKGQQAFSATFTGIL